MLIFKSESRLSLLCVWCDRISLSLEDRKYKINPDTLYVVRNERVDAALNESLCRFDRLFAAASSDSENHISLDFPVTSLGIEEIEKIKSFFHSVTENEEAVMIRCIKAMAQTSHRYLSSSSYINNKKIVIDVMYCLLRDIRTIRAKPSWYRRVLVLKQKLLGIRAVDSVTCSVLHLATWDAPYWRDDRLNDKGLLCDLHGLRSLLLSIWK